MVEDALVERLVQLLERLERREAMPQQEWFSIKQAGAYCGLSAAHIRRASWAARWRVRTSGQPTGPPIVSAGRTWRNGCRNGKLAHCPRRRRSKRANRSRACILVHIFPRA